MRRKIGTVLDERLVLKAKAVAARQGKPLNQIIEEALRHYLAHRGGEEDRSLVMESAGTYRITPEALKQVLEEDPLDTD